MKGDITNLTDRMSKLKILYIDIVKRSTKRKLITFARK